MKKIGLPHGNRSGKVQRFNSLYLRLRSKFCILFLLMVLLPIAVLYAAAAFHVRSLAEENACKSAQAGILQDKTAICRYLDEMVQAAGSVREKCERKTADGTSIAGNAAGSSFMENTARTVLTPGQYKALSAIYLIKDNKIAAFCGPDAEKAVINAPQSQQWYRDILKKPGEVYVLGTVQRFYEAGRNRPVFCIAEALSDTPKASTDILLFDFDYSFLTAFLGSDDHTNKQSPQKIILDFNGNTLYSTDPAKLTIADEPLQQAIGNNKGGFTELDYNGIRYYLTFIRYPDLKWTFVNLNPTSNVTGRLWLRSTFMAVCIFILPALLIAYLAVSIRFLNPINELTAVITDYESPHSDSDQQMPLLRGKMPQSGPNSTSEIGLLINKIYSIQLRQKEAELNSLQNQINPHFLYNTLESIRGAALYHGIHDIAAMSRALSLLFRYSISEHVLVTIHEELQHLENYISIQNFRFENKFELQCSMPPELGNYKILKLTLQPLIENSIKHGLEMKLGKGTIKIDILSLNNSLKIRISDDGVGMQSKKIEELNRSLINDKSLAEAEEDRSHTGIGVRNVNSRIKLYFGGQYGLKFVEAPAGTTVEITLPAVKEDPGGNNIC